jgi:beta-phosphoglucomutase
MIKGIFFDMDGVLVDAKEWHYESLNRALDLFGLAIDRDAHLATFDGLPTRKKLEILSRSRRLPKKLHSFLNKLKQSYTIELTYAHCRPTFHHQFALARLKQEGLRIAVCSNSIRATVELMMELTSLSQYLDVMMSNEDVTHSKPHPEIYLAAMERCGLTPQQVVILEDNDHGIEAARASGAYVMVVGSPADVTYGRIRQFIDGVEKASP